MSSVPATGRDFLNEMFGLAGKTALVVDNGENASSYIATMLAKAGAEVVLANNSAELVDPVVESVRAFGGHIDGKVMNAEDEGEVVRLFEALDAEKRNIDIFVSACGMTTNGPLETMTGDFWDLALSANLRCVFLSSREAVKRMVASGNGGRVILISTIGAFHPGLHGNAAYGAGRCGVLGVTRAIAFDYAKDGVRANSILPGAFMKDGKFTVQFAEETQKRIDAGQPVTGPGTEASRRPLGWGNPDDIGAAVVFLAGPSGSFISGQALTVDGGFQIS